MFFTGAYNFRNSIHPVEIMEGIVGRRIFRNYYKGHMHKTKGEVRSRGGREVSLGWGSRGGEKMQATITEQQ